MTDLIPLDTVRNEVARLGQEFLDGGSPTAANVLNLAMDRINTIPTIDPAAIREAALIEAARIIVTHEMGTPMHSPPQLLTEAHDRILALIGEKK